MHGFIKLRRRLLSNPCVMQSSAHLAVWVYLLLSANFADCDTRFGGRRVRLKAGQLITGRRRLAEALHLSESKVQRILDRFEAEQQISQCTTPSGRLITICNWARYQGYSPEKPQATDNDRTASEQQTDTVIRKEEEKEEKETGENARAREAVFGSFGLVRLTPEEHEALLKRLGAEAMADYIERLDYWLAEGHEKRNHYATICNWYRRDRGRGTSRWARLTPAVSYDRSKAERLLED